MTEHQPEARPPFDPETHVGWAADEKQPEAPAFPGVARYRVREPVTVYAVLWTGGNADVIREFGADPDCIPAGCYVVMGVTGHVFTVDAGRFADTYEPAGETEAVPVGPVDLGYMSLAPEVQRDLESGALVMPPDEFAMVESVARTFGMGASPLAAALDVVALGRIVHETRLAENAKLDRPFNLEPWDRRSPSQQALDMKIAEAVAAAVLGSDGKGSS